MGILKYRKLWQIIKMFILFLNGNKPELDKVAPLQAPKNLTENQVEDINYLSSVIYDLKLERNILNTALSRVCTGIAKGDMEQAKEIYDDAVDYAFLKVQREALEARL